MVRAFSFDDADHHRQLESARTGAGRIEQKHSVDDLVAGLMTVAEHDDVRLLLEQLGPIDVCQKNSPITDGHANDVVAIGIIVVAADERDRRDLIERFDDVLAADIAGMQNRIDTLQRRERFRSNQAVRVGDDSDAQLSPRCWPSSPSSSPGIGL
jgi:hypothetical protein